MKITLVKCPNTNLEVIQESSVFCAKDYVYFIPENDSFVKFARNMYDAEKEKNEWIRRYEKCLQGLNYWKERALSNV